MLPAGISKLSISNKISSFMPHVNAAFLNLTKISDFAAGSEVSSSEKLSFSASPVSLSSSLSQNVSSLGEFSTNASLNLSGFL